MLRLAIERGRVVSNSESWHSSPWVGIGRAARFRLRAARTGGEDRQLVVSRRRLRVPADARAAVPACPWLARGASWIRDNTP